RPTTISALSLHDALPILPWRGPVRSRRGPRRGPAPHRDGLPETESVPEVDLRERRLRAAYQRLPRGPGRPRRELAQEGRAVGRGDRKSTRLNSSHVKISY